MQVSTFRTGTKEPHNLELMLHHDAGVLAVPVALRTSLG